MRATLRGFSLIELAIVLVIIALLVVMAESGFAKWIANAQIRTVAEALQNDLRRAQTEAIRRNRQVALVLTNDDPTTKTITATAANAKRWTIRRLPLFNSDEIAADAVGDSAALANALVSVYSAANTNVTVTGDASLLCFNSVGRLVASTTTIIGVTPACDKSATMYKFDLANAAGDRPLRIQVYLGGQIRLCDPATDKTFAGGAPDACS